MVSSFYAITDFISQVSLAHPSVKSFTFGTVDDIDTQKQTQFPNAHLTINDATITDGSIVYNVTYFVLDRVGAITPESSGSLNSLEKDYKGIDNSIDVWNTSFETINDVFSYIKRNPDAMDYEIVDDAVCVPFKDRFQNLLCGWGADFSITVGNQNNICTINI